MELLRPLHDPLPLRPFFRVLAVPYASGAFARVRSIAGPNGHEWEGSTGPEERAALTGIVWPHLGTLALFAVLVLWTRRAA